MNVNLIVIEGHSSLAKGGVVDLYRLGREFSQKHGIVNRGGRVDFYCLGNVVSVTSGGYLTVYLTVNKALAPEHIEEILRRIGGLFSSYHWLF